MTAVERAWRSDVRAADFSDKVLTDDALARLTTFNNVITTGRQAFLTNTALSNIAETT